MTALNRYVATESKPATALVTLVLTVAGSVGGLVGVVAFGAATAALVENVTGAAYIVSTAGVQAGFGAFAAIYLYRTGEWDRYARFRRPTPTDAALVLVAFALLSVGGFAANALISAAGLPTEEVVGSGHDGYGLETPSLLWVLAFVVWFLFRAPLEELFYRGIVQTRLRAAFSAPVVVALGAGLFALSHTLFSALSGAAPPTMATTFIQLYVAGLAFCWLYERTDNLVPVAVFHALTWLSLYHTVERLFLGVL